MIASPGDVQRERDAVRDVLDEWNSVNGARRGIMLLPLGWETDIAPEMGDEPQKIINKRILKDADLLVGIFWTRLGTPTSGYASGAVEEIEEHLAAGRPAMLYFSAAPALLDSVDPQQYAALKAFNSARGQKSVYRAIRDTKDAPNLIVLLENSGAIAGLVLAALGIGLSALTGSPMYDGIASVLIGLVLAATAVMLLIEAKGLLIGEAADPELVTALHDLTQSHAGVVAVKEVLTVHQAPDMVVAIIGADFEDTISARDVEQTVADIETAIAERFPLVTRVYIRPMGG